MNPQNYRIVFMTVTGILALLVASPALSRLLVFPRTDFFSELWILGPNHMAKDYPYNIVRGQNYSIFVGVTNHLGYAAYYLLEVKFRNSSQSAPYDFGSISNRTPSTLPSLYNLTAFVADEGDWEASLTFSFDYVNTTFSTLQMQSLSLNNVELSLGGYSISWSSQTRVFAGFLFFELWIYNRTMSVFQYHGREVRLALNMTV